MFDSNGLINDFVANYENACVAVRALNSKLESMAVNSATFIDFDKVYSEYQIAVNQKHQAAVELADYVVSMHK